MIIFVCQVAGPKVVCICLFDDFAKPLLEEALKLEMIGNFVKAQGMAWIFLISGGVTEIAEDVRMAGGLSVIATPSSITSDKAPSIQRAKDWWRDYAPQNMPLIKQNIFMTDNARKHLSQIERLSYDGAAALAQAIDQGLSRAAASGTALDLRAALQEGVQFTGLFANYSRAGTHAYEQWHGVSCTQCINPFHTTGSPTWNDRNGDQKVVLWNNKGSPAGDNMQVCCPWNANA